MRRSPKEQSQIDKLMKLGGTVGLNGDQLLDELSQEIASRLPPSPEINWEAIVEKISLRVETRVAVKLSDTLAAIQQAGNDPQRIGDVVKGVAELLQPQIGDAANKAAEMVFQANAKALLAEVSKRQEVIDKKLADLMQFGEDGAAPAAGSTNLDSLFGKFVANLPALVDAYAKIMAARQPPIAAGLEQLKIAFKLADSVNRLQKGESSIAEIGKAISESATNP